MTRALIGELAKRVGVNAKTIRYYEDMGLLSEPERTESGYRLYSEQDVERLRFIMGAKALGLSLAEIKEIVGLWGAGVAPCSHVAQLLSDKLKDLDRRIAELVQFRDALAGYMDRVEASGTAPDVPCRHIDGAIHGQWHAAPPDRPLNKEGG
ncbi:MAG: heavy metal-responsive transcriptional regulator [Candidatus Sericytochromatia bacterium]